MSKSVLRPLLFQIQPLILRRLCHQPPKEGIQLSNTERPPKDPPDEGYEPTSVDHDGIDVPDFVNPAAFRQFSGPEEQLGPGAGKAEEYKNGHYFAYHRFSFYELQTQSAEMRDERRLDGGLQASIEVDEESVDQEKHMEVMKKLEAECDEILAAQAKEIKGTKRAAKETAKEDKKLEEKQKLDEKQKLEKKKLQQKEKKPKKELEEQEKKLEKKLGDDKKLQEKKLKKKEKLEEMTEEELKEWCLKKEAAIKEKEKLKTEIKGKGNPKEEMKGKEKPDGAKAEKRLQDMNEKELLEWCLRKEADIKEIVKEEAEQAKKCSEQEAKKK